MLLKSITLPEDKSESEKKDRTHYTNPQLFSVHFLHSSFSFVGAMCVHFSISIQLTHNEEKENVICFYLVVTLLFLWRCAFFDDVWQKHIKASKKERKLVSLTLAAQRCVEMNPVHIRAPAQAYTQITYFRQSSGQHFTITAVNGLFLSRLQASFMSFTLSLSLVFFAIKILLADFFYFSPSFPFSCAIICLKFTKSCLQKSPRAVPLRQMHKVLFLSSNTNFCLYSGFHHSPYLFRLFLRYQRHTEDV